MVTIGSNAAEDCAHFLNLAPMTEKAIVMIAGQCTCNTPREDASRNFIDALNTASLLEAVGKGEVLVANEVIHRVMEVTTNKIACP